MISIALTLLFGKDVKENRSQKNKSFNGLLPVDADSHNGHPVIENPHDEAPDNGSEINEEKVGKADLA